MDKKDNKGWISLHRKIQDHWLYNSRPFSEFQAWCDIIMEVNHKARKVRIGNNLIMVERGESINSLVTWSKRWGWTKSKVRRFLSLLETDTMIERKPTHKTTHIKVCNYDSYQGLRHEDETQTKRKRNADETLATPNNNVNNYNNDNNVNKESEFFENLSFTDIVKTEFSEAPIEAPMKTIYGHFFEKKRPGFEWNQSELKAVDEIIRKVVRYIKATSPKTYERLQSDKIGWKYFQITTLKEIYSNIPEFYDHLTPAGMVEKWNKILPKRERA